MCEHVIINIQKGVKLNWNIVLADNAMLKIRPELFREWDFEKNDEIGLDIYRVTFSSRKVVSWKCSECDIDYDMAIKSRVIFNNKCCCPIEKKRLSSLAVKQPDIASQWHPTKNTNLLPHDVSYGSNEVVWWLGECGHSWDAPPKNRTGKLKQGCPYCSNSRMLIGFNDMWATNPDTAKLLLNPEDGYKHTQSSNQKADWKCPDCKEVIRNKVISSVALRGVHCHICSDYISFPEKFMCAVLKNIGVKFEPQKTFKWSEDKRYDFYLPQHASIQRDAIIETHGGQHYIEGFVRAGGKTLKEVKEIDKFKEDSATKNKISDYIIIDARESTAEWIKKSLYESPLVNILNLDDVDWNSVTEQASSSLVVRIWEIWNKGNTDFEEIGEMVGVGEQAVRRYVKRGHDAGRCTYTGKENTKNIGKTARKRVVQLTLKGGLVQRWDSIIDATFELGKHSSSTITRCCKGGTYTAYGFIWLYEEEYDSPYREELVAKKVIGNRRSVVQLSLDGGFIKEWHSINEAQMGIGKPNTKISSCCKGESKSGGGFKWMYKEDYDKMIKENNYN